MQRVSCSTCGCSVITHSLFSPFKCRVHPSCAGWPVDPNLSVAVIVQEKEEKSGKEGELNEEV